MTTADSKNMVLLSDEQLNAFRVLFPNVSVSTPAAVAKKERRQRDPEREEARQQIAARFKKMYPFS